MRKLNKIYVGICLVVMILFIYQVNSFAIVAKDVAVSTLIVSKGVAIILTILQYARFILPILFVITKIIINKRKNNEKNNLKNIIIYIVIAIVMFILITGIGELLLNSTSTYGYSSKTIDYIHYNGKVIYYHR